MNIKYLITLIFVIILAIFSLFTYEYISREAEEQGTSEAIVYEQDGLPRGFFDMDNDTLLQLAANEEDPEQKAIYKLRETELIKKENPGDLDLINAGYKEIYNNTDLNAQERALALFKISQQANGHNRFDLLDEFLSPEERLLPDARKNYLVNKLIYDMYPMGVAYMDIRFHEMISGEEYNEHEVYMFTIEKLNEDVENYRDVPHLANLIPDLYMRAAATLSWIDDTSIPGSFVTSEQVLSLLDSGHAACDSSRYIATRCTTRDFIEITRIDYLLKIGEVEIAEQKIDEFLASDLRPMIRAYITEYEGLSLGRYRHLEARTDLVEKLKTTIPTLPDPS